MFVPQQGKFDDTLTLDRLLHNEVVCHRRQEAGPFLFTALSFQQMGL